MSRSLLIWACALGALVHAQAPQEYELNDVNASVTLNGVSAANTTPAITTTCPAGAVTADLSSQLVGAGWEVGITPGSMVTVSGGAVTTPGGQIVNIDVAAPGVTYLYGGLAPDFSTPFPAPTFQIPFLAPPTVGSTSFQLGVLNVGHPDGFSLSQGCQLDRNLVGTPPFPGGDDVSLSINTGPGTCLPAPTFYGTSFTSIHVSSNGRILFGSASNDFSPSIADALSGAGFFGFWTDFNPNLGGSVSVSSPTLHHVRATWTNVPFYGEPSTSNDFSLTLDCATGEMTIDGLLGVDVNPVSNTTNPPNDTQFLGASAGGAAGATDGGATLFAAGMSGAPAIATDMIYDWFVGTPNNGGTAPSLLPGTLDMITITPMGGSYVWQAN